MGLSPVHVSFFFCNPNKSNFRHLCCEEISPYQNIVHVMRVKLLPNMAYMLICLLVTEEGLKDDKDDPSRVQVSTSKH